MPQDKRPLTSKFIAMSHQEREFLYKLYVKKDQTAEQIAAKFGYSERFVYDRLKNLGITKKGFTRSAPKFCCTCGQLLKRGP